MNIMKSLAIVATLLVFACAATAGPVVPKKKLNVRKALEGGPLVRKKESNVRMALEGGPLVRKKESNVRMALEGGPLVRKKESNVRMALEGGPLVRKKESNVRMALEGGPLVRKKESNVRMALEGGPLVRKKESNVRMALEGGPLVRKKESNVRMALEGGPLVRKKESNVRMALEGGPLVRKKESNVRMALEDAPRVRKQSVKRMALAVGGVSSITDPCGACFVWEVKGPNNSGSSSTQFNLLTPTRCNHFGTFAVSGFEDWRAAGHVTGFDKYTCTRTKITVCGTFKSRALAQRLTTTDDGSEAPGFNTEDLGAFFDITDDSCPVSLINATLRAYTATTAGTLTNDNRCTNRLYVERPACAQPDRTDSVSDDK